MKRLSRAFKEQFIGLSKRQAMRLLNEAVTEGYNIYDIDYVENGRQIPEAIYINYGNAAFHFDKKTRRINMV